MITIEIRFLAADKHNHYAIHTLTVEAGTLPKAMQMASEAFLTHPLADNAEKVTFTATREL